MLGLHGCDLAIPSVLHQKVLEVLFQHAFDHMLQPRVLLRQSKHLLQTVFYLALDEADLLVHFVQGGIVRDLLAVAAGPLLFLSSLIERHYSITLPQFLNLPEEEAHFCQLLLQLPQANILNPAAILRIDMGGSFSIGLSLDALPHTAVVVMAVRDGLAVIEQFFSDRRILVLEVCVYFRELNFGEDCGGSGSSVFGVGYHQQYYCKNNQRKVSSYSIYQDLDICYSLLLLSARPLMRRTGRTLCRMDLKDLPLSGICFSFRWDYLRVHILSVRRSLVVVLLGDQMGELEIRVPLGLYKWKEVQSCSSLLLFFLRL